MNTPHWLTIVGGAVSELSEIVERRRREASTDPVAEGVALAVSRVQQAIDAATDPTVTLSPSAWGAAQRPPVAPQVVRRWCERGELPGAQRSQAGGWKIPATTERVRRSKSRAVA
jgi:hypothetical protein